MNQSGAEGWLLSTKFNARCAGAARGIGLACCRSMAQDGAAVALADIDITAATAAGAELAAEGFQVQI